MVTDVADKSNWNNWIVTSKNNLHPPQKKTKNKKQNKKTKKEQTKKTPVQCTRALPDQKNQWYKVNIFNLRCVANIFLEDFYACHWIHLFWGNNMKKGEQLINVLTPVSHRYWVT